MNHWHDRGFILGDLSTGVVLPALHSLFLMSESEENIHHCTAFFLPNVRARRDKKIRNPAFQRCHVMKGFVPTAKHSYVVYPEMDIRILGLGTHEPVRGATRFGGLQNYALRILGHAAHLPVLEEL